MNTNNYLCGKALSIQHYRTIKSVKSVVDENAPIHLVRATFIRLFYACLIQLFFEKFRIRQA